MGRIGADAWAFGESIERQVVSWLTWRGYAVIPCFAGVGASQRTKAPVVFSPSKGILVSPDIFAIKPERAIWVEVKGKSIPGYYFNLERWEHGLDWHLVDSYRDVQAQSGAKVWIVVFEEMSPSEGHTPHRSEMYNKSFSCLKPSGLWLQVSLDRALKHGEHRKTWPDGDGGKLGKGGLLWPRNIMQEFQP